MLNNTIFEIQTRKVSFSGFRQIISFSKKLKGSIMIYRDEPINYLLILN
jgi:hypothetical protein